MYTICAQYFHHSTGMACDALFLDRRNLIISVVILGLTLSTVFLAYFSFSDASESSDIAGIKFAAFVSLNQFYPVQQSIRLIFNLSGLRL